MSEQSAVGFTVVIPAYNPGTMLREALDSVAAQTRPPEWVVVVDDGSTDGTHASAVRWMAERKLPGAVVRQENRGISFARNVGLAGRHTDTIALLDADDVWLPNHLANLARAYALFPEAIVAFGDSRFFGDARSRKDPLARKIALPLAETTREEHFHRLSPKVFDRSLPGQFFPISASSFRMDVGEVEPRFATDLPVGEDRYLFLQLARRGRFVYCDEQTARTRRHETNTTHSDKTTWLQENALIVLEKIRRDPELALSDAEKRIVDETAQRTADAMLYTLSRRGIAAYRDGRRTVLHHLPHGRTWSLRGHLRALAATAGIV